MVTFLIVLAWGVLDLIRGSVGAFWILAQAFTWAILVALITGLVLKTALPK